MQVVGLALSREAATDSAAWCVLAGGHSQGGVECWCVGALAAELYVALGRVTDPRNLRVMTLHYAGRVVNVVYADVFQRGHLGGCAGLGRRLPPPCDRLVSRAYSGGGRSGGPNHRPWRRLRQPPRAICSTHPGALR